MHFHTPRKKKSILSVPCGLDKIIISRIPSVQFLTTVLNFACSVHLDLGICLFEEPRMLRMMQ